MGTRDQGQPVLGPSQVGQWGVRMEWVLSWGSKNAGDIVIKHRDVRVGKRICLSQDNLGKTWGARE